MHAALTRSAVVSAATELFADKGFSATSIDDIARRSNASKGAVYHHFSDKRQIFAEVFRASEMAVIEKALQSVPTDGRPWERLAAATSAFLSAYVEDTTARALLSQVMGVLGWERVRAIDDEIALPIIRAAIEEHLKPEHNRDALPVNAAAEMLFSLYCNGILHIAASDNPAKESQDVEKVILAMLTGLQNITGTDSAK